MTGRQPHDLVFEQYEIGFHVKLLIDAGLLEGEGRGGDGDRYCYYPRCLTNEGYNFLDAAKNDTLWNKNQLPPPEGAV